MVIIKNDDVWKFNDMARKVEKIFFIQKTLNWARLHKKLNWCLFLWKQFSNDWLKVVSSIKSLFIACVENKNANIVIVFTTIVFVQ